MKRRKFSHELKLDAANLILNQGYTYKEAQQATGVSNGALWNWVDQIQKERQGETPVGSRAITEEKQKVETLEKQFKPTIFEPSLFKRISPHHTGEPTQQPFRCSSSHYSSCQINSSGHTNDFSLKTSSVAFGSNIFNIADDKTGNF